MTDTPPRALDDLALCLEQRIDGLDRTRAVKAIASDTALSLDEAAAQLEVYLNESRMALRLVQPHLRLGFRVLEIGSGIGFFSAFLHENGVDIVELEPVGTGFEFMGAARAALAEELESPPHLDIGVDELDPAVHGTFDLVYSLNVLEHVPDWRSALRATSAALKAPDGVFVQSCPNYSFPYEPHFGIPLLPVSPGLTAKVLPRRISSSGLWKSLNWITTRKVRQWGTSANVEITFEGGQLADALERVISDPEFRRRRGVLISFVATVVERLHLHAVIRRIPPAISTPMQFTMRRT